MKLLYLSPVPWQSYAQRPHFMVRSFLERHHVDEVMWLEPYCARLPQVSDVRRSRKLYDQKTSRLAGLRPVNVFALPVEPIWGLSRINLFLWQKLLHEIERFLAASPYIIGIGRPVRLGVEVLQRLQPCWSFYDAMDDFPEFHTGLSRWSMNRQEERIVRKVDSVIVSSTYLEAKFRRQGISPRLIHNACEIEPKWGNQQTQRPYPVLGYVGSIASWFDWDLVIRLALELPEAVIRLAGPVFVPPGRRLPENIEMFPPCPHSKIGEIMTSFTVGLIPFRLNRLTQGVDPIKYYEYRSLGLPVLSTRFGEMTLRGSEDGVFFLDAAEGIDVLLEQAQHWAACQDEEDVKGFYRRNNWDFRFKERWTPEFGQGVKVE